MSAREMIISEIPLLSDESIEFLLNQIAYLQWREKNNVMFWQKLEQAQKEIDASLGSIIDEKEVESFIMGDLG